MYLSISLNKRLSSVEEERLDGSEIEGGTNLMRNTEDDPSRRLYFLCAMINSEKEEFKLEPYESREEKERLAKQSALRATI